MTKTRNSHNPEQQHNHRKFGEDMEEITKEIHKEIENYDKTFLEREEVKEIIKKMKEGSKSDTDEKLIEVLIHDIGEMYKYLVENIQKDSELIKIESMKEMRYPAKNKRIKEIIKNRIKTANSRVNKYYNSMIMDIEVYRLIILNMTEGKAEYNKTREIIQRNAEVVKIRKIMIDVIMRRYGIDNNQLAAEQQQQTQAPAELQTAPQPLLPTEEAVVHSETATTEETKTEETKTEETKQE